MIPVSKKSFHKRKITTFITKNKKTILRVLLFILSFAITLISCNAQSTLPSTNITPGAYQLEKYISLLKGKRVGLVVNQTSVINNTHLVDTLLSLQIDIKKVFAPEHGFRGKADAGEKVKDGVDTKTNLPIISLYGKNRKPTIEQFSDLDIIIFDIQDVGTRFYTFISTMHYVMETASETDKKVFIFDRPNPNGMYVEGPVLDMDYKSFVGMHPIPILHGLTVGELAEMINGEKWLDGKRKCDLTIIPMENWDHSKSYSLPIKSSPNLPNDLSIQLYPSLCMFEGTNISLGRGTLLPFQQIGHPSFTNFTYSFTPESIDGMAKYPKYEDEVCYGIKFDIDNGVHGFDISYLIQFYNDFKKLNKDDDFFIKYFNTLAGNSTLKSQIIAGKTETEIKATWEKDLNKYKVLRKKYLRYPDFE